MATRYGALTLQLKNLSDLSNIGSTFTNIFSATGKQVLSGIGSGSFSYSARDNSLHTAVKAADGQVAYIYQTDAVASGAAMDVCCIIIDSRNITTSPDGATVTVSGADILDQLTYTNAGTGAIDNGSGGPSTTDIDDIMGFAAPGWSYTATGTGGSTRSSTGSYHATKGDNVLQLLVATAKRSGDIFRLSSYSPPAKVVAWRASADSSGVTLRMPSAPTDYDGSTTTGIILSMTEDTDVSERITGVRPFGAGVGDGRLDITGISSSNTGGDPTGYTTTFASNVIVNSTLETTLGYTKRIDVDFSEIGVEDGTNSTQLTSAAVELWREAINYLQERDGAKTFYRLRCIVPYDLRPGQTVAVNYTEYEGGVSGGSAVWSVNSSFTIHEVSNSVGQDGIRYTDLQIANTVKKRATPERVMAEAVRKTQNTTRKTDIKTSPGSVSTGRTINTTQPIRIDNSGAADLSADRTLTINGLSTVGSANQIPGANAGGTAWEYKTVSGGVSHGANSIVVHAQSHVLASTSGLGADHTVSGLTSGQVLRATGATTAAFGSLQATDLPSHVLATNTALGSQHTISGATAGHVLRASGATTAAFAQLQHGDLGGVSANQHHNQSHVLATTSALGADHTVSGLTSGQVLKATGATAARFVQLLHSELGSIGANDHHNQSHSITSASDHTVTGAALSVVGLTATNTLGVLVPSSSPTGAALLRSDSSGYLTLLRSQVSGAAGTSRDFAIQTGGVDRWLLRGNNTAESGSNAGTDFQLLAYSDAGAFLSTAMQITRATGYVSFTGSVQTSSSLGVGTVPSVPVHIAKSTDEMLRLDHTSSGGPFISFYTDSLRHAYLQARSDNAVYLAAQYGGVSLLTGSAGTPAVRMSIDSAGDAEFTGSITITTNGNQEDRFLMTNSNLSGSVAFYDFNQTDRDGGSTGALVQGFYRDGSNITQTRMSKEIWEVIIYDGGTYYFPLEVRGNQVILAELPTSNPGIIGALYRSGSQVLVST